LTLALKASWVVIYKGLGGSAEGREKGHETGGGRVLVRLSVIVKNEKRKRGEGGRPEETIRDFEPLMKGGERGRQGC